MFHIHSKGRWGEGEARNEDADTSRNEKQPG